MLTYSLDEYLDWVDSVDTEKTDDFCWWRSVDDGIYDSDCCGIVSDINPIEKGSQFKYCPFCGKKIKIYGG